MEDLKQTTPAPTNKVKELLVTLVIIFLVWFFFLGGQQTIARHQIETAMEQVPQQMQQIKNQVAEDAVKQYGIAERQGDKMQMYVQAGLCAAAYLQAQDEPNYNKWKAIQESNGRAVGIKSYK